MSKKQILNQISELPEFSERKLYIGSTEQGDYKAIVTEDLEGYEPDQAVSVVSRRYSLTQHENAFKKVLDRLPESTDGKVYNYKAKASMKLYPDGENEEDIGLWVVNSVDKRAAIRISFFQAKDEGDVYIPKDVVSEEISGYKRIHRGEWTEEYEDFLDTISEVREIWGSIVNKLDDRYVDEEDIEEVEEIIGKKATKKMEGWLRNRRVDDYVEGTDNWKPTVWDLVIHGIKFVSQRLESSSRVASEVTKEERLRKLSSSLISHALAE